MTAPKPLGIDDFIAGMEETMNRVRARQEQPPTPHQLEQEARRVADIKEYGNFQEFNYKNVRCYMQRTTTGHRSWCGYLDCGITADTFERLEGIAPGGMTAHNGFDCCHLGDYPVDLDGEYRDYAFVRAALERMVDEVTRHTPPPQP